MAASYTDSCVERILFAIPGVVGAALAAKIADAQRQPVSTSLPAAKPYFLLCLR
jgi:hypothetical protein